MEYLMTYGWAILVIAIIVSLLFALGLFSGGAGTPSGCVPQSGFSCTNPSYGTNGISATISQDSGQYYLGAWVFVASSSEHIGSSGLPVNFSTSNTANMQYIGELGPTQSTTFYFKNTSAGAIPTANVPVGYPFIGDIWLGYCTTPGCNTPTSFTKVGTINVKSSGSGFFKGSSTTVTSTTSTSTTSTSTTINYVNITLDSTGGSAASGFQQILQFNPSSQYSAYEASDLGNLRFYQGDMTPSNELYSWCESGCTSSSTSATFWIKTNGLPSGTTTNAITIYFEPQSGSMGQYSGPTGHAGEAPQLTALYGQYDNGVNVFTDYWNFSGTILPSSWSNSGAAVTVDNGVSIPSGASSDIQTAALSSYMNLILEGYANQATGITSGMTQLGSQYYYSSSEELGPVWGEQSSSNTQLNAANYTITAGHLVATTTQISAGTWQIIGDIWQNGVITWFAGDSPSATFSYAPPNSPTSALQFYYNGGGSSGGEQMQVQWVRSRAYPPSGVMPSASFGSVQ